MEPDFSVRLKRGHLRKDGLVFWGYSKLVKSGEIWTTKSGFLERKAQQKRAQDAYLSKNREKRNERARAWSRSFRDKHPDKSRDYSKRYYANNQHACAERGRKYRARKMGATCETHRPEVAACMYEISSRISNCIGIRFHVDHILPLSKGGRHHHDNLQIIPSRWNLRKNDNPLVVLPHPWKNP